MSTFTSMREILRPGKSGDARIEFFTVSKRNSQMTALRPSEYVPPGKYVRLCIGSGPFDVMMSDTPFEQRSNYEVVWQANGDVLIAGLGLGMILVPILAKSEVTSVTVVEKNPNVIKLVEPRVRHKKLTVIEADILAWRTEQHFDTIYFDIWREVNLDNLPQIASLHRRFARRKKPGGWMSSWEVDTLRYRARQERDEVGYLGGPL